MHVCTCVHICVCVCVVCVCACVVCVRACVCERETVCVCMCMCKCVCVCVCLYMCVCTRMRMWALVYLRSADRRAQTKNKHSDTRPDIQHPFSYLPQARKYGFAAAMTRVIMPKSYASCYMVCCFFEVSNTPDACVCDTGLHVCVCIHMNGVSDKSWSRGALLNDG